MSEVHLGVGLKYAEVKKQYAEWISQKTDKLMNLVYLQVNMYEGE